MAYFAQEMVSVIIRRLQSNAAELDMPSRQTPFSESLQEIWLSGAIFVKQSAWLDKCSGKAESDVRDVSDPYGVICRASFLIYNALLSNGPRWVVRGCS